MELNRAYPPNKCVQDFSIIVQFRAELHPPKSIEVNGCRLVQ